MNVANAGIKLFASPWNEHPLLGIHFMVTQTIKFVGRKDGTPREATKYRMLLNDKAKKIPDTLLPSPNQLV